MITFACPDCEETYAVPAHWAGRVAPCLECGAALEVPEATGRTWLRQQRRQESAALWSEVSRWYWEQLELERILTKTLRGRYHAAA